MGFPGSNRADHRDHASAGQGVGSADHGRRPRHLVRQCSDDRPAAGWTAQMTWTSGEKASMRIERVEEPTVFGFTWGINGLPDDDPRRTYVEFTLAPTGTGTRLTVVESGFAQLPEDELPQGIRGQHRGLGQRAGRAGRVPRCHSGLTSRPSPRRSSPPWPTRAGGRSWPHSRPAGPPRRRIWPLGCRSPVRPSPSTWRCWPRPGWWLPNRGSGAGCDTGFAPPPCRWHSSSWPPWPGTGTASSNALQDHLDAAMAAQPTRMNKGKELS